MFGHYIYFSHVGLSAELIDSKTTWPFKTKVKSIDYLRHVGCL